VNDTDQENKKRNREIAENESARQTVSAIRVSGWAVAAAVVIGLAAIGWVLLYNN
jgi:F0F1-type ATP synthase assembly protein I